MDAEVGEVVELNSDSGVFDVGEHLLKLVSTHPRNDMKRKIGFSLPFFRFIVFFSIFAFYSIFRFFVLSFLEWVLNLYSPFIHLSISTFKEDKSVQSAIRGCALQYIPK